MSLPDDLLARLWGALTLDGNGNLAIRTTAAILGSAVVHNANMDWGLGATQVNAGGMPIADAGNYYTTDTVEAALQQIGASIASGQAPAAAKFIIQVANGSLTNAQVLGSLATGIVKNTTTTGVLSIATAGTDYYNPGGTKIALADGGLNAALTASLGGIVYSTASAGAVLAGTSTARQMLQSGASAAPAWSTTTWPATTTVNRLLWSSATNVISDLATANSSILVTDGSGVPSLATDIPTAVTIGGAYNYRASGTDVALLDGGTNASLVANNGGIVYSSASAFAILAGTATAGKLLRSGSTAAPTWSTATFPDTATGTGTILRADGTNWVATTATYPTTTTTRQLLYSSADNVVTGLATANSALLVTNSSGTPSLSASPIVGTSLQVGIASTSTGSLLLAHASSANVVTIQAGNFSAATVYTWPTGDGSANQALITNGSGVLSWATANSTSLWGDGSTGAVTWSADTNLDPTAVVQYTTATLNISKILSVSSVNTPLVILASGNVTINGTINLASKGGALGAGRTGGSGTGSTGTGGHSINSAWSTGGGSGGPSNGANTSPGGGGGGGSMLTAGTAASSGGGGGAALTATQIAMLAAAMRQVACGAGGGGGGTSNNGGNGGDGGAGGGALVMYIGGNLTLGASSVINVSGANGTVGVNGGGNGGGGGGGGAGGSVFILVQGTITNSGCTFTVTGGTGAAGGTGSSPGLTGANGAAGNVYIYSLSTGTLITA